MRKYGKYEKMPDDTRAKQPEAKSALLQTYLTSLLCMVLCVTMFFGTSYAWFTSEVNNVGNEIYIGILDVGLAMQVPDGDDADADPDYISLSAVTDGSNANTTKLYTSAVHWEPGYTSLKTVRVENKGDLAFNYALSFTDGKADGKTNDELLEMAKWFDIWVFDHQSKTYEEPAAYADINDENGWTQVGTLADVLVGTNVFEGEMDEAAVTADSETAHTYTIALHMDGDTAVGGQQEALNMLMGQKISLNVKLVATQLSSEPDDFGNGDYDINATPAWYVNNVNELLDTLVKAGQGDTVVMKAGTYVIDEKEKLQITTNNLKLKGEGADKTIIQAGATSCSGQAALYISANNVTVSDLKIISTGDIAEGKQYSNIDAVKVSNLNTKGEIINNVTLRNLVVTSNGNGVNLHGVQNAMVDRVSVAEYRKCGFSLADATNVKFTNCTTAEQVGAWADVGCMYTAEDEAYKNPCQFIFDETNQFGKGSIYSERPESAGYDTVVFPEEQWTKQADPNKGWALIKNAPEKAG